MAALPHDDHHHGTSLEGTSLAWRGPNDANDDDEVNANDDECVPTINCIAGMTNMATVHHHNIQCE
jgi:hypothetical protein